MKSPLHDKPSPGISTTGSTSTEAKYGHEIEVGNSSPTSGDFLIKNGPAFVFGVNLDLVSQVLAEGVGTFILMFCICGIVASTVATRGKVGLLEYAATAGLTVIVIVFSIGFISGAHVNPAITLGFAALGHFPWSKVPFYLVAQIMGATSAAFIGPLVYGIKPDLMSTRPAQTGVTAADAIATAFWVELIATAIVMFLATSIAYQSEFSRIGHLSGFIVGIAIGLSVMITGPMSGGSLNPARSLGPAIVSWNFDDVWIYIIAPTVGAVAGAFTFRLLRLRCLPCFVSKIDTSQPERVNS
ncbi:probable aquaporin NIP7-1 [Impatiens glandulifera]|uniref:probable aquaporin NIP7-1 n=1 Tax=Impatiens glandulifera TaxID=253017 RepID=UPI001FB0A117|nr:probable aquaporin NIP7-1 [Impatiens glandulifera]